MSNAADRANKMLEGLKDKTQKQKEASNKSSTSSKPKQLAEADKSLPDPRGRKRKADSKRSRLASGELSKLSVLIPAELHTALSVMAAKDKDRDMSDIVTGLLQKHIKIN